LILRRRSKYVHEWSVIYGYDDEQRVVYTTDPMRSEGKTVPYETIIENPIRFLAVIHRKQSAADDHGVTVAAAASSSVQRIIHFAVNYAINGCDYVPKTTYLSYASGLAAYDCWLHHLQNAFSPNRYGLGQLTAVYAETRHYAAKYLQSVQLEGEVMQLVQLASKAYEQAAVALSEMSMHVPFIRTSEGIEPEKRDILSAYLEKAKADETSAIGYLQEVIAHMEKGNEI